MEQLAAAYNPYSDRRRRARQLSERYTHAGDVLTLYSALLDVQETAFQAVRAEGRPAADLVPWTVERVLPEVIATTVAAGPPQLAEAVVGRFHSARLEELFERWLAGKEQSLVDRYLARAALTPVLEATGTEAVVEVQDERHCPRCGGLPQLAYLGLSGEALVTGPRYLLCSRCSHSWQHPRAVCAACGETSSSRLTLFSEGEQLPHLRIDACETCRRYLIAVDLRKDAAAVPVVDELAATPLDLFAKERGLSKVVPNLMGF